MSRLEVKENYLGKTRGEFESMVVEGFNASFCIGLEVATF